MTQPVPSLARSIATGAIGFGVVSFCVFATAGFGEHWMYQTFGKLGAYLVWTVMFILLGGAVFGSIVVVRWRPPRFYLLFALAFFAYAAAWIVAYFMVPGTVGEVVGALAGSVLMALVFAAAFGAVRSTVKLAALIFILNALGYFLGAALLYSLQNAYGFLLFGIVYGVFFGAAIGASLHLVQRISDTV